MDLKGQQACCVPREPSLAPRTTANSCDFIQSPGSLVVEGVEAEKCTEALRIMVPALPEPELCTLADSAGAQLLEATHSAPFSSESRLKQRR